MPNKKSQSPAFKLITRHLGQLSREEVADLDAMVGGLLEALTALQEERAPRPDNGTSGVASQPARPRISGYIEIKTINGCGPYKYLRFRQGGRLRSEYIGKG
jgi:hypothetical protein